MLRIIIYATITTKKRIVIFQSIESAMKRSVNLNWLVHIWTIVITVCVLVPATLLASEQISLTALEKEWVKSHKTVRIGTSDYPPLTFVDNQGNLSGVASEYLNLISERTGLIFVPEVLVWPDLIKQAKSRGIDMFSGLNNPARDKYLNFSIPYLQVAYVTVNRHEEPYLSDFSILNGQKVAVIRDWTVHKLLETKNPEIQTVPFDTVAEALFAVSTRRVAAYVGDLLTANYQIQKNVLANLKIAGPAPFNGDYVRFAVRKDWPELVSIFNKTLHSIPQGKHNFVTQKWLQVQFEKSVDWPLIWFWAGGVGLFLSLIIFGTLIWNRRMATSIKNQTDELKLKSARLSHHVQNTPLGCISWDRDFLCTEWNKAAEKIFGYSALEAIGRHASDIIVPEEIKPDIDAIYKLLLSQKGGSQNINENITKGGKALICNWYNTPIVEMNGEVIGVTSLVQDVTERRTMEQHLRNALGDAERSNQAKSEFLATMSHEFRTPLNAILGFSEMIRAQYFGPVGSNTYEEYASDIHDSGQHMLALVNDMLDMAAIEAGKRFIAKEDVDVKTVFKGCINDVSQMAKDANIVLSSDIPVDLAPLYADKRALVQITHNLLSNAIKFTERDGTIEISASTIGHEMILKISDTGIGIPSNRLISITEPFSQAHDNAHITQNGTGLGLTIVKSLVELHEGELNFESVVGNGTTVTITFPLRPVEPE